MRQQVVREADGLGALQVRVPGHQRVGVLACPLHQRVDQIARRQGHRSPVPDQPQPQRGDDSVVAGQACSNLGAGIGDPLEQRTLDRRVDVFISRVERESAGGDVPRDAFQGGEDGIGLGIGDEAGAGQGAGMCCKHRAVLVREQPVERQAFGERDQLGRRLVTETAAPELRHRPSPCRSDHTFNGKPHSFTKPAAASWSNRSPASYVAKPCS